MAKTTSKSKTAYYSQYKSSSRWAANRKRKLEKQLKLQPGNEQQIKTALGNISYRRRTPNARVWAHSARKMAQVFKYFSGRASIDLFSSNPKVQAQALQQFDTERKFANVTNEKVSFSLAARAHDKWGKPVWS